MKRRERRKKRRRKEKGRRIEKGKKRIRCMFIRDRGTTKNSKEGFPLKSGPKNTFDRSFW